MAGRLIDADALLARVKQTDRYFTILFDVERSPTVIPAGCDVRPDYRGQWLDRCPGGWADHYATCSRCGERMALDEFDSYCPNCGAQMVAAVDGGELYAIHHR